MQVKLLKRQKNINEAFSTSSGEKTIFLRALVSPPSSHSLILSSRLISSFGPLILLVKAKGL